jgi:signal transduction histidine kinase
MRAAAVLVVLGWAGLVAAAWSIALVAGDDGLTLQKSSFVPRDPAAARDGAAIADVLPGSPAWDAGIRPDDVLVAVEGVPAGDTAGLARLIYTRRASSAAALRVRAAPASSGDLTAIGAPPVLERGPERDVVLTLRPLAERPGVLSTIALYAGIGAVVLLVVVPIAVFRPGEPGTVVLLAFGAGIALMQGTDALYGGVRERWLPLGWDPVDQLGYAFGIVAVAALLHLFLVFPAPRPLAVRLRAWRPAPLRRAGGGVALLYAAPLTVASCFFLGHVSAVVPLLAMMAACLGAAAVALAHAYWRPATPLGRAQVQWILVAVVGVFATLVAGPLVESVSMGRLYLSWGKTLATWVLLPLTIAFAVLRYRLFDVSRVLGAALLYPLLGALLAGGYVGLSFALSRAATVFLGGAAGDGVSASVLAALLVAAAAAPLRHRLHVAVDRFVNAERRAVRRFHDTSAEILAQALPEDEVAALLTEGAARDLNLVGAWFVEGRTGAVRASAGAPVPALTVPEAPEMLREPGGSGASGMRRTGPAGVALLARVAALHTPVLLSDVRLPAAPLPSLDVNDPAVIAWREAGARVVVPLRPAPGGAGSAPQADGAAALAGAWVLGQRRSWDLPDRDDLARLGWIARRAALVLDRARLERERLEARLAAEQQRLERERAEATEREKDELLSAVSHELRTPLTAIKGFTQLLLAGDVGALTTDQRELLEIVDRNADRQLGLVNDLLDVSRLQAGRLALRCAPLDMAGLVADAAATFRLQLAEKAQRLTVHVPDALPRVLADPARVAQILANLLSNAHKYTPAGGAICISAGLAAGAMAGSAGTPGFVRIEVADSGIGLTSDEQRQVFERFFRAKNRTVHETSGAGLGLAITRQLVVLHGGEIHVTSAPGQGSTFGFTLPVAPAGTAVGAPDASGDAAGPAAPRGTGPGVVLTAAAP